MSRVRPTEEAYAELQQAYDHFNERLFDGKLPGVLLTLQREKDTFGYFSSERFVGRRGGGKVDEIALNPAYFSVAPLVEVLQTIAHECVHQWQFHFGEPSRGRYHNREWSEKMEEIGLMPSDTGKPGGKKVGQMMGDYAIAGGRFLAACEELVAGEFTVSWLDRFPSAKVLNSAAVLMSNNLPETSGGGRGPMHELVTSHIESGSRDASPIVMPAGQKNQTRSRYVCACDNRVWGRPSLNIICGECKNGYVPG